MALGIAGRARPRVPLRYAQTVSAASAGAGLGDLVEAGPDFGLVPFMGRQCMCRCFNRRYPKTFGRRTRRLPQTHLLRRHRQLEIVANAVTGITQNEPCLFKTIKPLPALS